MITFNDICNNKGTEIGRIFAGSSRGLSCRRCVSIENSATKAAISIEICGMYAKMKTLLVQNEGSAIEIDRFCVSAGGG